MRHQVAGRKFSRNTLERKALFFSLARGLIIEGEIKTTLAKAKTIRGYFEKMITTAKKADLAARRNLLTQLRTRELVNRLVDGIAPVFKDRPGGYLRIIKLGERRGDNAPLAKIEFVSPIAPLREAKRIESMESEDQQAKKEKPGLSKVAEKKLEEKNANKD